jgi:hypothetical protein
MKKHPSASISIVDASDASILAEDTVAKGRSQASHGPTVLALDLEATLISSAVSQFPRPFLAEFLIRCQELFPRIVMFTTIDEERFRRLAKTLVDEGLAPSWFQQLECVKWTGPTKDLAFIPGCTIEDALLVDDLAAYIHPGQENRWVQVEPFEPPFDSSDRGLTKVLAELEKRVRSSTHET